MRKIPTYEYYCKVCEELFTEQRGITQPTKFAFCPNDKEPLYRKYGVSVSFKGSGFYTNDKNRKEGE